MFKTAFLIGPGLPDPFSQQGEEAAEAAKGMFPGLAGCVQTRALAGQDAPAFSGVFECFFRTQKDALAAAEADVSILLAPGAEVHSAIAGMERVVMRTPDFFTVTKIKGVYPFCRKPGMSIDDFQHHWWHTHGPIAALTEEAYGYVQVHPLKAMYERAAPAYDGITEIYWPDQAAAMRAVASRQMVEDQGGDAPNFVDLESVALFFAEEELLVAP